MNDNNELNQFSTNPQTDTNNIPLIDQDLINPIAQASAAAEAQSASTPVNNEAISEVNMVQSQPSVDMNNQVGVEQVSQPVEPVQPVTPVVEPSQSQPVDLMSPMNSESAGPVQTGAINNSVSAEPVTQPAANEVPQKSYTESIAKPVDLMGAMGSVNQQTVEEVSKPEEPFNTGNSKKGKGGKIILAIIIIAILAVGGFFAYKMLGNGGSFGDY